MITLKNLASASPQEVFDQVARHLLTQGQKCMVEIETHAFPYWTGAEMSPSGKWVKIDKRCKYRSNGLSCAAGCLIADDEYSAKMEDNGWDILALNGIVPTEHVELISTLQNVHDMTPIDKWKEELLMLAQREGLSPAVLEEFQE